MQNKLINPEKNGRVNVQKIINGTCVVLLDNIQCFYIMIKNLETAFFSTSRGFFWRFVAIFRKFRKYDGNIEPNLLY